jgi:hypothetical protein
VLQRRSGLASFSRSARTARLVRFRSASGETRGLTTIPPARQLFGGQGTLTAADTGPLKHSKGDRRIDMARCSPRGAPSTINFWFRVQRARRTSRRRPVLSSCHHEPSGPNMLAYQSRLARHTTDRDAVGVNPPTPRTEHSSPDPTTSRRATQTRHHRSDYPA